MKTAIAKKPKVRTVQEWIRLRKIELRRIEKEGGKLNPAQRAQLFLVPERANGVAQQMEFTFEAGPKAVNDDVRRKKRPA